MPTKTLTRPQRVLVVCGSHWPRALLRAQLRGAGYDARGAASLKVALAYLGGSPDEHPGLVIVNWLPLGDGRKEPDTIEKLAQRLRAHEPGPQALVLCDPDDVPPPGAWDAVVPCPVGITGVVALARALLNRERG